MQGPINRSALVVSPAAVPIASKAGIRSGIQASLAPAHWTACMVARTIGRRRLSSRHGHRVFNGLFGRLMTG